MPRLPRPLGPRNRTGGPFEPWFRRGVFVSLLVLSCLALANLFGQQPETYSAAGSEARLEVRAPAALRSGLLFEVRLTIDAVRDLRQARLVLDPGWFDGMALGSAAPEPAGWSQEDGSPVIVVGHLPQGERYVLRLEFQANAPLYGNRRQNVLLEDGHRPVARVTRDVFVYP